LLDRTTILRTKDVPGAERISFWTQALSRVCSGLQTDGYGASTLDGRIKLASIGRLKLCDITASRHRIILADDAADTMRKSTIKIVYQLVGKSVYQQGGEELSVNPGDLIVYDVSRPHVVINTDTSRHLVVAVPKDLALLNDISFAATPLVRSANENGVGGLAMKFVRSAIDEKPEMEPNCEDEITDTILRLLRLSLYRNGSFEAPASKRESLNLEIKRFIQRRLQDPELSIGQLAAAFGCSKRLLHQAFADEGMTINEYLWASRLEKCRRELDGALKGGRSITDIAFSWGFSSSSHFSRSFRSRFGYAPSAMGSSSRMG
jgi:AraC-like DNA-binding protein